MKTCLLLLLPLCLGKVVFLLELCRHGARSPIEFSSWDSKTRWPDGPGKLTSAGMRQHFLIGKTLRDRYQSLFATDFSETLYAVISTDVARTMISAENQVMGLFPAQQLAKPVRSEPPLNADFLNETSEVFNLLPVFTQQRDKDLLLRPQVGACKKLTEKDQNIFTSKDAKKIISAYPELIAALKDALSTDEDSVVERMELILDSIDSNIFAENTLPPVLTSDLLASAKKLHDELFSFTYKSETMTKLWSSAFLSELAAHLEAVNNGTETTLFRLYSAHDTTLAAVLSGLESFDKQQPPFASTLLFEVSDDKTLRILYNDNPLNISACASVQCPISTFLAYLKTRVASNLEEECENRETRVQQLESHLGHWLAWLLLSFLVMGLFAAASAVFASFVVSKRHLHLIEARDIEGGHSSGR